MANHATIILLAFSCSPLPLCSQAALAPQALTDTNGAGAVRAEAPVTAPKVKCDGNQLSIVASNSTLGSILADLRKCNVPQVDLPEAAAAARIYDELGPGPAPQVLDALLTDSGFNFVIGRSMNDPARIESILVMDRAIDAKGGEPDARNLSPNRKAFAQMHESARPHPPSEQAAVSEAVASAATDNAAPAHSENASRPSSAAPESGGEVKTEGPAPVEAAAPAASPPEPVKSRTDEQITNMQQLFEQRRQMIKQQTQTPPAGQPQ